MLTQSRRRHDITVFTAGRILLADPHVHLPTAPMAGLMSQRLIRIKGLLIQRKWRSSIGLADGATGGPCSTVDSRHFFTSWQSRAVRLRTSAFSSPPSNKGFRRADAAESDPSSGASLKRRRRAPLDAALGRRAPASAAWLCGWWRRPFGCSSVRHTQWLPA